MSDTPEKKAADFDRVLLAMDVVDTLRHQKSLVERELSAAADDGRCSFGSSMDPYGSAARGENAAETVAAIAAAGGRAEAVALDVTDSDAVAALVGDELRGSQVVGGGGLGRGHGSQTSGRIVDQERAALWRPGVVTTGGW